jgi:hypothetical protein
MDIDGRHVVDSTLSVQTEKQTSTGPVHKGKDDGTGRDHPPPGPEGSSLKTKPK